MGETDIVLKNLKIVKKAQFNMIELYRLLKSWFDLHEYSFFEKEYEDVIKSKAKSVTINWQGAKEIDDYTRHKIDIKIILKDYEIIESEGKKKVDGDLSISINGSIELDYDGKWDSKPMKRFFRAFFDKFMANSRRVRSEKEIKEDCYDVYHRAKAYLNLEKFR